LSSHSPSIFAHLTRAKVVHRIYDYNHHFISLAIPLDGAYPPPDTDVANYLLRPASSFDNVQRRFAVFFKCLFSVVQEELSRIRLPHEEKAFAVAWRAHLNSERSRMYKDVVVKSQV